MPPPTGGLDTVRTGNAGERARHADLARLPVEDERVRLVEPAPARTDPVEVEIQRPRDLGGQRRATELDEEPVGRVAKLEVARVDAADPPSTRR